MASIRQLVLALVMLVVLLAAGIGGFYIIGPVLQQLGGSGPGPTTSQVEQTQIPAARVSPGATPSPTRFLASAPSALPERTATAVPPTPLPTLATPTPEALPSPSATSMPTSAPVTAEAQATDASEPAEVVTSATATGTGPEMGPQILAAPGELTVSEPDGTGIFTITLSIEPLAPITIPLSVSNEECLVATSAVRLDSDNWRRGVGVQVAAVDDEVNDGPQTCAVTLAPAISQAADYGGGMASGVTVTVEDEDMARIAVVPTELAMSEPDGSGTFTVTLGSEPLAAVTIPLSVSNEECMVTPTEVRLDRDNWRRGAAVRVAAVDDDVDDGPQTCAVTLATAISQALDYGGGVASSGVTVTVEDEDTAGIAVAPRELTMSEPDGSGTFTVTLSSEPLAAVIIPLRLSSQECLVTPVEVRLDRDNWRRGVEVQVAAVDDAVDDGPQTCAVTLPPARSQAAEYVGQSAGEVVVTVEDEDTAGIAVTPRELAMSEPSGSGSFTVTLSSEPLVPVTIPLSVSNEECLVASEVRLDGGNWQRGAEVQVTAANDERNDGPQTCTVTLAPALSQAAEYAGQPAGEVVVTVEDEDTAGIAVTPEELAMSEPDGSGTFTITLSSEPLAAVTIPLSVSGQECVVEAAEASLNSENWRRGVGVRVAAVDDDVDDGPQMCAVTLAPAVSTAADYGGRPAGEVLVTVADEDVAGIAITPGELALSEPGEAGTFTVTLSSEPTATVVISLTTDAQVTVNPTQLTFTDADWQAAQSVVVTAVDDLVAEGQHNSPIRPVVRSQDQNYAGLALGEVTARITDNDTAGVVVRPPQVQLTEGGTPQSYAVLLASQPAEPVTVTITTDGQTTVSPTLLVFTEVQWNVPQTVTVKAGEDEVAEGPHSSTIRHSGSSKDPTYLDAPIDQVMANVADKVPAAEPNPPAGTEQAAATGQPGEEITEGIRLPVRITPTLILVAFLAVCVILATMFELLFSGRRR